MGALELMLLCVCISKDHKDLTIISTNFGDGGNAHSEYLSPLAEQGFLDF